MNGSHVAGGGAAAIAAAIILAILRRYTSIALSESDASAIGSAAIAAGIGAGHLIGQNGLLGLLSMLLRGRRTAVPPTP